jgi:hypothetical protein
MHINLQLFGIYLIQAAILQTSRLPKYENFVGEDRFASAAEST